MSTLHCLTLPHFSLHIFLAFGIVLRIFLWTIILAINSATFVLLITSEIYPLTWLPRDISWRVKSMISRWFHRDAIHIDTSSSWDSASHFLCQINRCLNFELFCHCSFLSSLLFFPFLLFLIFFITGWYAINSTYQSHNSEDNWDSDYLRPCAIITRAWSRVFSCVWS